MKKKNQANNKILTVFVVLGNPGSICVVFVSKGNL